MKTKTDLVSFLIAAYNEEQYIVECIDSCLNQTYPRVEVCVTDDGSEDNTWRILQQKYSNNPRVKLDKFEKNRGKVFAFNNSYNKAEGHFFALLGADDASFDDRIESSYRFLNDNQFDLIFAKRSFCDENLVPLDIDDKKIEPRYLRLENLLFSNFCHGPTLFFNRKIAKRCFPIPQMLLFEDWWIGFNAMLYGQTGFFDKYVTKYRQHGANDVSDAKGDRIVEQKKKNYVRHPLYYLCFYNEIIKNHFSGNKQKYIKIILLNYYYRKLVLEDKLVNRLRYLPKILKFPVVNPALFLSIPVLIFGSRLFNLKKLSLFKRAGETGLIK